MSQDPAQLHTTKRYMVEFDISTSQPGRSNYALIKNQVTEKMNNILLALEAKNLKEQIKRIRITGASPIAFFESTPAVVELVKDQEGVKSITESKSIPIELF